MAETGFSAQLAGSGEHFVVEELDSPDRIRSLLKPRIEYTAHGVAQLEPGLKERARWFLSQGSSGTGIVVHSKGGLGDALLASGDPAAVGAILHLHPGSPLTYATFQPHHSRIMRRHFRLATSQPMTRMAVRREEFVMPGGTTVGMTGADIRRINALYSSEGVPTFYSPEHIDAGLYRGVNVDGRLVALAGTHVISRQERVAVVGNVFTHPEFRGHGYAKLVTGAVTELLLQFCDTVVLTVDPNNTPAISAYRKLGYRESCQLVESTARRRDLTGIRSAGRRFIARIRGRRYPGALVTYSE